MKFPCFIHNAATQSVIYVAERILGVRYYVEPFKYHSYSKNKVLGVGISLYALTTNKTEYVDSSSIEALLEKLNAPEFLSRMQSGVFDCGYSLLITPHNEEILLYTEELHLDWLGAGRFVDMNSDIQLVKEYLNV